MTDQPTPEELRAAMEDNYPEEDSYPEPSTSPEPTPPEPTQMSLEAFQSLSQEEQATIWNLISLTKDDTTKILELVQPTEGGEEDPMQALLGDILEMIGKMATTQHEHTSTLEDIKKRLPPVTPAPPAETPPEPQH